MWSNLIQTRKNRSAWFATLTFNIIDHDEPQAQDKPLCLSKNPKDKEGKLVHWRWERHCVRCWKLSSYAQIQCRACKEHFCDWCMLMHQYLDRAHER